MHTVYIPVEVKARAWTAKLVFAAELVQNGFGVVTGPRGSVLERALADKNGIYIEKDFFYIRSVDMRKLKKRGFLLYAYDEEGLVYSDDQYYISSRTHGDMLMLCDKVFTWGSVQEALLKKAYPFVNNLCKAGNPRIDLITGRHIERIYEEEIKQIKKTGNYILVNSNFTSYGDPEKYASEEIKTERRHGQEDKNPGYKEFLTECYRYTDRVFESMLEAIYYIAKHIDMVIVIRVHPTENMDKWKKVSRLDNVRVVSKYDANPWIYCSEAVIHSGCTTAAEAYLMGKTVIAYMPCCFEKQMRQLPNDISIQVKNKEQLLKAIKESVMEGKKRPDRRDELENHLFLVNGAGRANKIMTDQMMRDSTRLPPGTKEIKENRFWNAMDPVMEFYDQFKGGGRKFPYESKKNMKNRLKKIQAYLGISGIRIRHIGKNTFYLKKK